MARNDLPPGYGGWQAIDATPQEESDYKMQCGPTSLVAIRRADIGLNYDSPFVFAEVNAALMHWGEDPQSEWGWSRMKMNKYHIGRAIMTKSSGKDDDFGDDDGEDVVNDYKNTEGSVAERMAIQNAIRGSRRAMQYYNIKSDGKEDVAFDLIDIDKITKGHSFQVKVVVRNESNEKRKVYAVLNSRSLYYTGVNVAHIKKAEGTFVLEPNGTQEVAMTVQFSEYWPKLVEQCLIKIYAICRVEETQQTWTDEDDFTVDKPRLDIQVTGEPRVRNMCEVTISFTNPLDVPLTNCHISMDGPGLIRPHSININEDVAPKEKLTVYSTRFMPRIHGDRKLIIAFNSKELFDITGTKALTVLKRE